MFIRILSLITFMVALAGCGCSKGHVMEVQDKNTVLSIVCTGSRWLSLDEVSSRLSEDELTHATRESEAYDFKYWRHSSTFIIIYSSDSRIIYSGLVDSFSLGSTVISLPYSVRGETIQIEFRDYRSRRYRAGRGNTQYVFSLSIPQNGNASQELMLDVQWVESGDAYRDFIFGGFNSEAQHRVG